MLTILTTILFSIVGYYSSWTLKITHNKTFSVEVNYEGFCYEVHTQKS